MAYEFLTGVPDPTSQVGYDGHNVTEPADPGAWPGSEVTGYYYVDSGHGSATDSNTYGYPDVPRLTIPTSLTIDGGKKIVVMGDGESYSGADIGISASGASSAAGDQAWFTGRSAVDSTDRDNWPILSQRDVGLNSSYVVFENAKITTVDSSPVMSFSNGTTARHLWVLGDGTNIGGGSAFQPVSDCVLYDIDCTDIGEWNTDDASDYHGVKRSQDESYIWITDFDGSRLQGDTVQIGTASGNAANMHHVFMSNVTGTKNKENCIDLKDCSFVVISGGSGTQMDQTWGDDEGADITIHDDANEIWVIGRETYVNSIGISTGGDSTNMYFMNCVFRDFTNGGDDEFDREGSAIRLTDLNASIINCTFYNCRKGVNVTAPSGVATIEGCLFASRNEDNSNYGIGIENGSPSGTAVIDWNFYDEGDTFKNREQSSNYTTLASWVSTTGHDSNSIEGDPSFIDAINDDYGIDVNSDAIDLGMSTYPSEYALFTTDFGLDIKFDFAGNALPASAGDIDAGAFQFVSGSTPTAPSGLGATTQSTTEIDLAWTDNSGDETGFKIDRSLTSGSGFSEIDTASADATTYSDTGLVSGTQYYYRVRAFNGAGNSAYTTEANDTTDGPLAPSGLTAVTQSDTEIQLDWTDNSSDETGFKIERSLTSGSGFSQIDTTAAGVVTYDDTGLTASTQYFYRVRSYISTDNSAYTSEANDTTDAPPAAPTLSSATIATNGTTWTLAFNENVNIGAGGSGGFAVTMSTAGVVALTYSSGDGTTSLVYTGDVTVNSGETASSGLDYTQPGNGIEDDVGTDLATFSTEAVTNNSTEGIVVTPVISLAGANYSPNQSVTLSTTTSGASIYYTTDGTTPDSGDTLYTGAITVSSDLTLKAIGIKGGSVDSGIAEETYGIEPFTIGTVSWDEINVPSKAVDFTVQFDVDSDGLLSDIVIGLSDGPISAYNDLAISIRFSDSTSIIDARNGTTYEAVNSIPYTADDTYSFDISVNWSAKTFSATVAENAGEAVTLATDYAFRDSLPSPSELVTIGYLGSIGGTIDNITFDAAPSGSTITVGTLTVGTLTIG